ncbi:MAG: hypothetical protein RL074_297 [Bacteroidota bacterium]
MKKKPNVLLILEGTYPYNGGGVSTWAHILCNEIKNANFTLYSINASYEEKSKYTLSDNVKRVVQVPQWEPKELIDYGKKYYKLVFKKNYNDEAIIDEEFIPIFTSFLKNIKSPNSDTASSIKCGNFFSSTIIKKPCSARKFGKLFTTFLKTI